MKSKTRIARHLKKKNNLNLVETIRESKGTDSWKKIAEILSMPRRKRVVMNLSEINEKTKGGENVLVPGKVLSQGEMSKKIKIVALEFSETAREKLSDSKINYSSIYDEIKKNPGAKNLRILTGK